MEFTAKMIAGYLQGTIEGDENATVTDVSKIEEGEKGTLAFLANPKYEKYIYDTEATIVLVNKDFQPAKKVPATLIRVENAYKAFAALLQLYESSKPKKTGISENACIDPAASIGKDVFIGSFAVIESNAKIGDQSRIFPQAYIGENVIIGKNCIVYPGAKIYHDCRIGDHCIIHAGAVIGSDGFGFAREEGSTYEKISQLGNVLLEDHCEIGANVTIDRATMGSTILREGVKLDNLIQIAHNVELGANTAMAAQSGIAGSTKLGENCIVAAQGGIVGHLNIGNNVIIGAQSGVTKNIADKEIVLGSPAWPIRDSKRSLVVMRTLPQLRDQVNELENKIKELEAQLEALKK